jgi:hypothetical protein
MKKALVTIAIGYPFIDYWHQYCKKSWQAYANKYGYELIVFDEPLDKSERAANRSPAWQKCLILNHEKTKGFERVVWLDADILINDKTAPDIVSVVPREKIGGTDSYSFYSRSIYKTLDEQRMEVWKKSNVNAVPNKSGKDFYNQFGIETDLEDVIQTGVLVLTPSLHNEVLLDAYYKYEDKSGSHWNYEMRPLSYEIVKRGFCYFIDDKFNYIFGLFKFAYFPETLGQKNSFIYRLLSRFKLGKGPAQLRRAIAAALSNSYFLHFAGCGSEIKFTNSSLKSSLKIIASNGMELPKLEKAS